MKKVAILIVCFVAFIAKAQNEVVVQLEKIEELKVYKGLTVNLIKSEEQKLEILGEKAADVTFKNKNGTLKISLNLGSSFDSNKVTINLYYNSIIPEFDVNQGATITSDQTFKQKQLILSAQDGGIFKLDLAVDYLKIKGLTGGIMYLEGVVKSQNINLVSGAIYNGLNLQSEQAIVYVSTGAISSIQVTEVLDAKAKFGGNVTYIGRPKSVATEESLGGKVTKATSSSTELPKENATSKES
ncbi:GIN domain-containing protein [Flavicella marina]|uniref:GIN domain-containing protein n=1 Tax=Flavicella marina TaxID=1475951 RepID=UPI0012641F8A|nr:DUF2807 domain-containing protein [Flavicella marina]